jgi:septum formation protein
LRCLARQQKPADAAECREYLQSYRDEPAVTVTALVVTNTSAAVDRRVEVVDVAQQSLAPIPESVIDALIEKGDVLHSAGGFTVEDPLLAPYLGRRLGTEDSSASYNTSSHLSRDDRRAAPQTDRPRLPVCLP